MAESVRVRACLAVVQEGRILLVPHVDTDVGPVQWVIPGGQVGFGESLRSTALREFAEETGLQGCIVDLLDVSEVLLPERLYHSITVTFVGRAVGGTLRPEASHPFGRKLPRWLGPVDLQALEYHPPAAVERALGILP